MFLHTLLQKSDKTTIRQCLSLRHCSQTILIFSRHLLSPFFELVNFGDDPNMNKLNCFVCSWSQQITSRLFVMMMNMQNNSICLCIATFHKTNHCNDDHHVPKWLLHIVIIITMICKPLIIMNHINIIHQDDWLIHHCNDNYT